MEAKLIVVGGKANKSIVKLTLPAVLGRGRDVSLTVAHPTVSRHHCMLEEVDGEVRVRDNNSLNGTLVDGEKITETVLRPGQTLTVGPITFRADYERIMTAAAPIAPAIAAPAEEPEPEPEFDLSLGEIDEPSASPPTIVEHEKTLEFTLDMDADKPVVSEEEGDEGFSLSLEPDGASIADDLSPSPLSPTVQQAAWTPPAESTDDDAAFDFLSKDDADSSQEEIDTAVLNPIHQTPPPAAAPKDEPAKKGGWWPKGKEKKPKNEQPLTQSESDEPTRLLPANGELPNVVKPAAAAASANDPAKSAPAETTSEDKGINAIAPGAQASPAASPDDDELNDFFQSLGLN